MAVLIGSKSTFTSSSNVTSSLVAFAIRQPSTSFTLHELSANIVSLSETSDQIFVAGLAIAADKAVVGTLFSTVLGASTFLLAMKYTSSLYCLAVHPKKMHICSSASYWVESFSKIER